MDRSEFDRLISSYPVVRAANSRREWRGSSTDASSPPAAATASAHIPKASPAPVASVTSSPPVPAPSSASLASGDFFTVLRSFLSSSYSAEMTDKIVSNFRQQHVSSLRNLSLDDMEILAKSLGDAPVNFRAPINAAPAPVVQVSSDANVMVD